MVAIPRKAATVILLRETVPEGFEAFLLKRHERSSFMAGNFVYPGGRVDPNDDRAEIHPYCRGLIPEKAHQILGGTLSPEESLAHWIAGIRELFEEAGVFLAYEQTGKYLDLKNPIEKERYSNYRDLLQKGKLNIYQMVQEENILFALDQLHYYAHWTTPEARSERFDARFFLAHHPAGQEASFDQKETTAGVWLSPREALEGNLEGEVILSPPTLKTLEDLSRFKSIEAIFESLKKKVICPILPVLLKISGDTLIVFPWDPEFEMLKRGEMSYEIDHGRPSGPGDNSTRLILKEGSWFPYCRTE